MGANELFHLAIFVLLPCPLPPLRFPWYTMAKSSQTCVRRKSVDQTLGNEIQETAHNARNSNGFWRFLACEVIHLESTKNWMLVRFGRCLPSLCFLAHTLSALNMRILMGSQSHVVKCSKINAFLSMLLMLFCRFQNHFSALYWKKSPDNLWYPDVLKFNSFHYP